MDKKELILAIVNNGYSDLVMEGARAAGARGGTIFNARGTGNPEIQQYFGVPIQEDKEMVLIIVDSEIKDNVLTEIYKSCGLDTKGSGICFSLPVGDTIGLTPIDLKKDDLSKEDNEDNTKEVKVED